MFYLQRRFKNLLAPLLEKKAELEAQLPPGSYSASATEGGAVAQGTGATAVGERGVHVGGNVGGSIITGDGSQASGIQANTIKADNVVHRVCSSREAVVPTAADLVDAGQSIGHTAAFKADSIEAKNVVSGFQYIADPAQATPEQLRQELTVLQKQLKAAIAAGEFENEGDAQDAQEDLAEAEKELAKAEPQGNRVVRKLKAVTEVLTESASAAEAAKKTGLAIIKLAPVAAALYQIATNLFAG